MRALLLAGVIAIGWTGMADASLIGNQVHAEYLFPNTSTVFQDRGTKTIVDGTTFSFSDFTIVFTDSQIIVTNITPGQYASELFIGPHLEFSSGSAITSVTEDPTSTLAFAAGSVVSFTASDIKLNLSGTCDGCTNGERIVLNVTTAASPTNVPEPASLALLGMGAAGIVAARRRRAA